jgi:hypothetical protein
MKQIKSVAILGMGPTMMRYWSDFEQHDGRFTQEVWTVNRAGTWLQGIDRIFAMDDPNNMEKFEPVPGIKGRNERLSGQTVPITTSAPKGTATIFGLWEEFPMKEAQRWLKKHLPVPDKWVLTNSINYAVLYALMSRVKELHIYGCEFVGRDPKVYFAEPEEHEPHWHIIYRQENQVAVGEPGLEGLACLLGYAVSHGVKVSIPVGSTLMNEDMVDFRYGYIDD